LARDAKEDKHSKVLGEPKQLKGADVKVGEDREEEQGVSGEFMEELGEGEEEEEGDDKSEAIGEGKDEVETELGEGEDNSDMEIDAWRDID